MNNPIYPQGNYVLIRLWDEINFGQVVSIGPAVDDRYLNGSSGRGIRVDDWVILDASRIIFEFTDTPSPERIVAYEPEDGVSDIVFDQYCCVHVDGIIAVVDLALREHIKNNITLT